MRHYLLLLVDLALIVAATGAALVIRDNFEFSPERAASVAPYLLCTLASAAVILPAFGAHRAVWGFTTMSDCLRIVAATVATIISAVTLGFVFNRMDGVARALPLLQGLLTLVFLVGARVSTWLWRRSSDSSGRAPALLAASCRTVLVVGVGEAGGLYARAVSSHAPDRLRIAGFLDDDRHVGRSVHGHPVLGAPERVGELLRDLELHGVFVDKIVVAAEFEALSAAAQRALLDIEASSDVMLEFLLERLGLGDKGGGVTRAAPFSVDPETIEQAVSRRYWRVKRGLDVILAVALLGALAPLLLVAVAVSVIDVGWPPTFWQQRPGRFGRPFKLYKMRTMRAAHDADGRRVPDELRTSWLGRLSRRLRLDELPQLFNILAGDMSFVGPRPLLPVDQPRGCVARLMAPPGLTGWAQVKGGRAISAADKAALDIWYLRNASLALDIEIVLLTITLVVFGERVDPVAIRKARRDLRQASPRHSLDPAELAAASRFLAATTEEAA
ncbi:sugar transferase [Methylosinus sp. Sm6]|uniref:sugar transferase n=1 Tax=Methylosinus sp. Sm6 TaxID=2866948 RepID=UPI001C997A1D|nr:sugar transferase [Methylosinus sp. Sm6]MBY6240006.1 sugar transferase [Methylosinus sp. Sm6]